MIELVVFGLGCRSLDRFGYEAMNPGVVVLFRQAGIRGGHG